MRITCDICGQVYSPNGGGHCRGGRYGGCCRTFSSEGGASRHRVGKFADGSRRCLGDAEMTAADSPWRQTARGWTDAEEWHGPSTSEEEGK